MLGMPSTSEDHYVARQVEALQEVVSEPVIGSLALHRRGLYTQKVMGRAGFLPWLVARAWAKKQAGGLPQTFIAAITPTSVRVFKYKAHGRMRDRYEIGEEVAVWERRALQVSWQSGAPFALDVTIEAPGEGEKVLCRCGKGESSQHALEMMADPAMAA